MSPILDTRCPVSVISSENQCITVLHICVRGAGISCSRTTFRDLTMADYRIEHDTLGEIRVPADRLWGAQTQRSLENFRISGERMPTELIRALALVKRSCARVNIELKELPEEKAR